jgi:integrase
LAAGYSLLSARDVIRVAAHLGRWLDSHGLSIDDLSEQRVVEFRRHRCKCRQPSRRGRVPSRRYTARVFHFVDYLRRIGRLPPQPAPQAQVLPAPLVGFREWMIRHRGLTEPTISRSEALIMRMLSALGDDTAAYDAALVRRVLLDTVRSLSRAYAKTFTVALRGWLRFLASNGRCRPHLHRAVPTIPEWKLSALPRYLEADDVERVIASCNAQTPQGVRDQAVLLLLARLALRGGDIVSMRLDDFDWRAGTLAVRGKSRQEVRLPLPQDVGDAVLDYLQRGRPPSDMKRVFLCANAPIRPFASSATVSDIVRLALKRAGIADPPSRGAHLLRHSAATSMLRSGASLEMIAAVLRHESSDTTAYYAKVDISLLQLVTQPWPEGAPC